MSKIIILQTMGQRNANLLVQWCADKQNYIFRHWTNMNYHTLVQRWANISMLSGSSLTKNHRRESVHTIIIREPVKAAVTHHKCYCDMFFSGDFSRISAGQSLHVNFILARRKRFNLCRMIEIFALFLGNASFLNL